MARTVQIILEVDDRGTARIKKFGRTVQKTARQSQQVTEKHFDKMARSVGASIDKITTRTLRWGGLAVGIFGGLAARAVIKFGAEFEASMSGVSAVTNASVADMAKLEDQARDLGATTAFTAIQAAEAMEELGKAGFEIAEITSVMPDVLNLAGAGMLEMAEAASITSDLVRSLGISISEFGFATDVIVKTSTSAKTTVSELGFAFQDAAPVARSLGLDVVQLNALLGTLANRGFTATRAGTALRRIFAVFLGDLEDGEKGLAGFGIELKKNNDGTVDFADVLGQFEEKGVGALEIMEAFGLRGGPAMLQIFRAGQEGLTDWNTLLEKSAGTSAKVFEERFNNVRGSFKEFTSALQEASLVIFEQLAPALRETIESATELARAWSENLAVSDVIGGFARVAKVAKFALVALGVVVGVGLVRKFIALNLQILQNVIGFSAMQLSAARLTGVMKLLTKATIAQRAAVAGLVVGVAVAAWQFGRMIGEVTGLDGAVQNFIIHAADLDDSTISVEALEASFQNLTSAAERLEGLGLGIAFPEEIQKGIDQLAAGLDIDVDIDIGDLGTFVNRLQALQKVLLQLSDEELVAFRRAFLEAGEDGKSGLDQIELALASLALATAKSDADIVASFKEKADRLEAGAKALTAAFSKTDRATRGMAEAVMKDFADAVFFAEEKGISADAVYDSFAGTLEDLEKALRRAGEAIPPPLQEALDKLEEIDERRKALLAEFDIEPLAENVEIIPELPENVEIPDIFKDKEPKLEGDALIRPPGIEPWNDFFETINEAGENMIANMGTAWGVFTEQAIGQVGSMVGAMATGQVTLQEGFARLLKNLAAQAVKMLVQWGIQRLIVGKIAGAATVAAATAGIGAEATRGYLSTFASLAATPIIGPAQAALLTPGIMATQLAAASGFGATGGALGAGIAAIGLGAGAEGGIITGRMAGLVEMGERGDELITPLRGLASRRAADELGLTDLLSGQEQLSRELQRPQGGGTTIIANLTFAGDNWAEDGVSRQLSEQVHAGLSDLIEQGIRQRLPEGRI